MAHTPSAEWSPSPAHKALLIDIARRSLSHGVRAGSALQVDALDHEAPLREPRACFVTLERGGSLRGCVGSLHARGPLVSEVARSAYLAGFEDRRFTALRAEELDEIDLHISVLSEPVELQFDCEQDLLSKLRPGVDGLILSDGARLGTFLPQVWEKIPEPHDFLRHLRLKAGLPADHWSSTLRVRRYVTCSFP